MHNICTSEMLCFILVCVRKSSHILITDSAETAIGVYLYFLYVIMKKM